MHERTDADITIVEIDPAVVQIAKDFFNFSEDAKMRVETGDGRFFLSKSKETYDYIVVDAYLVPLPPFHLTTYEFVEELRKHLNPGGIVFVNVISALEGSRSGMFKAIFSTYRSQFKNVYVFPSDDGNYSRLTNIVLLATDVDYGTKEKFVERISNLTNNSETISLASSYYDRPAYLSSEPLLTDDFCPIEMIGISSLNR
jgi:spermidine synthase